MFEAEKKKLALAYNALRRPKIQRDTGDVLGEYNAEWNTFHGQLEQCSTFQEWLDADWAEPAWCNIEDNMVCTTLNVGDYNRGVLADAIRKNFPGARSISEFGCGVGRNLLYLKRAMPEMEVYGYELCQPGVDVSRAAAAKFNIDVKFEQLNYLNMESGGALFPPADVSFTCYSLEQLPDGVDAALSNIQSLSRMGSLHLEPVTDNYPLTFRGLIGRLDHWKVGYLRGLDAAARRLPDIAVSWERIKRAHNPLMFPSMYVLKKTTL